MEEIKIKKTIKLKNYLADNKIRMQELGSGVVLVESKLGTKNPVEEISYVVALILEGNENMINTAIGITPVAGPFGLQFKGVLSFFSVERLFDADPDDDPDRED